MFLIERQSGLRKKCYGICSISAKSMYIVDSNQFAIEFVPNLLVLMAFIKMNNVYAFGRNDVDLIAFFFHSE